MKRYEIGFLPHTKLSEVADNGVILERRGEKFFLEADSVVLAMGSASDRRLYDSLSEKLSSQCEIRLAGDVIKPRKVFDALREGYLAGCS